METARRDWDRKKERAESARKDWEVARAELAQISADKTKRKQLETKVRNADRTRQNAKRAADLSKGAHSRAAGRLKTLENASKAAEAALKNAAEVEDKARRETAQAANERDAGEAALEGLTADLKRADEEFRRINVRIEERKRTLTSDQAP